MLICVCKQVLGKEQAHFCPNPVTNPPASARSWASLFFFDPNGKAILPFHRSVPLTHANLGLYAGFQTGVWPAVTGDQLTYPCAVFFHVFLTTNTRGLTTISHWKRNSDLPATSSASPCTFGAPSFNPTKWSVSTQRRSDALHAPYLSFYWEVFHFTYSTTT